MFHFKDVLHVDFLPIDILELNKLHLQKNEQYLFYTQNHSWLPHKTGDRGKGYISILGTYNVWEEVTEHSTQISGERKSWIPSSQSRDS